MESRKALGTPRRPAGDRASAERDSQRRAVGGNREWVEEEGAGSPGFDGSSSSSPAGTPDSAYTTSADVLAAIGRAFVEHRRQGRTFAWADLQAKVMSNPHLLIPERMTMKEWIEVGVHIEDFLKQEEGVKAEDPLAAVQQFLMGSDTPATDKIQ